MKELVLAAFAVSAMSACVPACAADIVGLYNTGVDDRGAAIEDGARDIHYSYSVIYTDTPTAVQAGLRPPAVTYFNTAYAAENAGSRWVSIDDTGGVSGDDNLSYDYQITFDLTGLDFATATISGLWGADDRGLDILVNGVSTGNTANGFSNLSAFTLSSNFIDGLNTIDFIVQNDGVPSAFRVDGFTGTANVAGTSDVPELASWGYCQI